MLSSGGDRCAALEFVKDQSMACTWRCGCKKAKIKWVNEKIRLCAAAVAQNGLALQFGKDKDHQIALAALVQNPKANIFLNS